MIENGLKPARQVLAMDKAKVGPYFDLPKSDGLIPRNASNEQLPNQHLREEVSMIDNILDKQQKARYL